MTIKQSPPGFKQVEGPLVEAVQKRLAQAGFDPGAPDGVWGTHTLTALQAWQQANNLPATGEIDDLTWSTLMTIPAPDLSQRALQLTGAWEGTGYGGANGNFDGQGITWGVVGFTWKNGELQDLLKEVQANFPAVFSDAFGSLEQEMVRVLNLPRPAQMTFAQEISIDGGERIEPAWAVAFKRLGSTPEVQAIENAHASHYWVAGLRYATLFGGLTSERGLALCFDIAVQNTVTDAMISEIQNQVAGLPELDSMQVIAQVVADHANPTYYNDVLKRKMIFLTGQGPVHGDRYDIGCWGIG